MSDPLAMIGIVTSAKSEVTAASIRLSATSPRARWVKIVADVPPGLAARSIIPTAMLAGRSEK